MNKVGLVPSHLDAMARLKASAQPPAVLLHNGKFYRTISVLNQTPPRLMKQVGFRDPLQLQLFWDEIVRRWPEAADSIINGLGEQASWADEPEHQANPIDPNF